MLHRIQSRLSEKRFHDMIRPRLHAMIIWIGIFLVLGISLFLLKSHETVQANAPMPADRFMQSVVQRDGSLGWHQLCPALQAQEPLSALASQVEQQRRAEVGLHLTLTVDYIGARSQPQGGQIRMYVVTAHRPHGWVAQRTYTVYTQANGCVDDVTTS